MKQLTGKRISAPFICIGTFLIYFAVAVIASVFLMIFNVAPGQENANDMLTTIVDGVCLALGGVIGCVFVNMRSKVKITDAIKLGKFDFMVPIMLCAFTWGLGEICDNVSGNILSNFMTVETNREIPFTLAGILSAVVIAPIFEELMFRYVFAETARGAYSIPIICIFNGLAFAVVHFYNIQGFMNVCIGGIFAAYVYCKTRNILYVILEHAIHNAL